ncbi:MAG: hypothetical protein U0270_05270 [Labilithrix sp.]
MRLVPWLLVLAIGGACALPSADEYARGEITADASGGGTPTTEAGASVEAGNDDGGDAGSDGTTPAGFCPRTAVYCNDFESGSASDMGEVGVSSAGSLAIAGGALEARLAAIPGSGYEEATAYYDLPSASLKATVEVDVDFSVAAWEGGNMVALAFYYGGQPNDHSHELYVGPSYVNVTTAVNDGTLVYAGATEDLPRGKRVRVKLEADFTPHAGSVRGFFDGRQVLAKDGIDFTPSTDVSFRMRVGLSRSNPPTPAVTARYDNLVISLP